MLIQRDWAFLHSKLIKTCIFFFIIGAPGWVLAKLVGPFPFTKYFLAHIKFSPENTGPEWSMCGPSGKQTTADQPWPCSWGLGGARGWWGTQGLLQHARTLRCQGIKHTQKKEGRWQRIPGKVQGLVNQHIVWEIYLFIVRLTKKGFLPEKCPLGPWMFWTTIFNADRICMSIYCRLKNRDLLFNSSAQTKESLFLSESQWRLEEMGRLSAEVGACGSSTRRPESSQSLGWRTAPRSWPGSSPLTSEVCLQSSISQREGLLF